MSSAFTAWLVHWVVIKATLYMLGIPSSVPFLEILAYAGYPFVPACLGLLLSFAGMFLILKPIAAFLIYRCAPDLTYIPLLQHKLLTARL